MLVCTILGLFINAYPNKKYLSYGIGEQLKDLLPSILLALVMGVVVYSIHYLHLSPIPSLLIQIPVGFFVYVSGAALIKLESFTYCVNILKEFVKKKK